MTGEELVQREDDVSEVVRRFVCFIIFIIYSCIFRRLEVHEKTESKVLDYYRFVVFLHI